MGPAHHYQGGANNAEDSDRPLCTLTSYALPSIWRLIVPRLAANVPPGSLAACKPWDAHATDPQAVMIVDITAASHRATRGRNTIGMLAGAEIIIIVHPFDIRCWRVSGCHRIQAFLEGSFSLCIVRVDGDRRGGDQ